MRVPFVDLTNEHAPYRDALRAAVDGVIASGRYVMGEHLRAFEAEFAAFVGARFAVGVSSGTDALLLSMMAHEIGPGDVVLTTPYSFYSTASVALQLGAEVAFVDIDPATYDLDPAAARRWFELDPRAPRVKAIIAVHLFGHPADLDALAPLANEHGAVLIEDAAQAIGTRAPDGQHVGNRGAVGCFSFFPTKNLGAFGDGGAVVTNDARLADRIRSLRSYGATTRLVHERLGGNHRLDELQAALLSVLIAHLPEKNTRRLVIADTYDAAFGSIAPARPAAPAVHAFHQYIVRIKGNRDALAERLTSDGIETNVYYRTPLHRQPCFAAVDPHARLPEADRAAKETLALPIRPTMTNQMVRYVADRVLEHSERQ